MAHSEGSSRPADARLDHSLVDHSSARSSCLAASMHARSSGVGSGNLEFNLLRASTITDLPPNGRTAFGLVARYTTGIRRCGVTDRVFISRLVVRPKATISDISGVKFQRLSRSSALPSSRCFCSSFEMWSMNFSGTVPVLPRQSSKAWISAKRRGPMSPLARRVGTPSSARAPSPR